MQIKVIYAAKPMVLTIDTGNMAERLDLQKMGPDGQAVVVRPLRAGKNVVKVDAGAYKVMSDNVQVVGETMNALELNSIVVNSKDDPPPDQPLMATMFDKSQLRTFIVDTKSAVLP